MEPTKTKSQVLELGSEARANLGLIVKPLRLQSYWRSIEIPATIVDRPGISDRGVTSPAVAVVAEIHAYPGQTVRPGDRLFTLRVFSEYLQTAQTELVRAVREVQLLKETRNRIVGATEQGSLPAIRLIEVDNDIRRQSSLIESNRQNLLTRGFSPSQIDGVAEGKFVSTIEILAPPAAATADSTGQPNDGSPPQSTITFEVQDLRVDLGQQVQAGQLLGYLANHESLYIEGHAFKREASSLEETARIKRAIQVDFSDDSRDAWPTMEQQFYISHLANTVDTESRTFSFYIPLSNQSRILANNAAQSLSWRFRPGQRARLSVPVEEFTDVLVLPREALVREGPEAFVFQQNGDLFHRRSVRLLHEDRSSVVIASRGEVAPGYYIAQNSAASLNRILKSQQASGAPVGMHVHADGTVHGAH
jgi:membrane fusion protein, heavy metal efflux system